MQTAQTIQRLRRKHIQAEETDPKNTCWQPQQVQNSWSCQNQSANSKQSPFHSQLGAVYKVVRIQPLTAEVFQPIKDW